MLAVRGIASRGRKYFQSVLHTVNQLSEEDAKSFLKIIYGKMDNYKSSGESISSDMFIKEMESIYHDKIPRNIQLRVKQKK